MTKYTSGRIFVWIGVLAWAPYFLLITIASERQQAIWNHLERKLL